MLMIHTTHYFLAELLLQNESMDSFIQGTVIKVVADSIFTPYLFLKIIIISFVEVNTHNVGPILFLWLLPCYDIDLFPYTCFNLPNPVFI